MKHTPAPWFVTEVTNQNSKEWFRIGPAGKAPIAVLLDGHHVDNAEANARLIAAAPDLLEALKYARRMVNASECDVAFIDSAIAKATP